MCSLTIEAGATGPIFCDRGKRSNAESFISAMQVAHQSPEIIRKPHETALSLIRDTVPALTRQ
jgi:hypothetical protein